MKRGVGTAETLQSRRGTPAARHGQRRGAAFLVPRLPPVRHAAHSLRPSRQDGAAHARLRLRNGREPRAARTVRPRLRLRPVRGRACDSPARPAGHRLPAPPSRRRPFRAACSTSSPRSTSCIPSKSADEAGGGRRVVSRPQAGGIRHRQRRGHADADRRSLGAQPRTAPLHAVVASAAARARRLHDRPPHLHERDVVHSARDGACVSPVARPVDRG